MSKSIMQDEKECYLTGATEGLHKHHILHGTANRKKAEQWGCWCWLRWDWHNMTRYSVHQDHNLDLKLKRECQMRFEALHGRETWMKVFGKNYLE